MGRIFVLLAIGAMLFPALGGCGEDEGSDITDDAGVTSSDIKPIFADVAEEGGLCPGYKEKNTYPESYQEFCKEFITDDKIALGQTCFEVPDNPDLEGCYCKICAIYGIEERCVFEVCN
ncbi:MAG: hypothetical protein HUU55_03185 [Myxococcales bacterium]|nr:hypothetical protein [Myxococcales bacterium]